MKSDQELFIIWEPSRSVSLPELAERVCKQLTKKFQRYGKNQCQELDALVYFNLKATFLAPNFIVPKVDSLQAQGWRSVSVVFLPYGVVLYAQPNAPVYLYLSQGSLVMAWKRPRGWFEPEPNT